MEPHEWANHFSRAAQGSVRSLETTEDTLRLIAETANNLRAYSTLDSAQNRKVDDVAVALTAITDDIEELRSRVEWVYQDFRAATTT